MVESFAQTMVGQNRSCRTRSCRYAVAALVSTAALGAAIGTTTGSPEKGEDEERRCSVKDGTGAKLVAVSTGALLAAAQGRDENAQALSPCAAFSELLYRPDFLGY